MRRRHAVMLSLVLAVAAPAGVAQAKGLTGLTACGANGCVDRDAAVRHSPRLVEAVLAYSTTVADPGPLPYVVLKGRMGHEGEDVGAIETVYFPRLGIQTAGDGSFHRVDPAPRRALDAAVRGLAAFPAPAGDMASRPEDADVRAAVAKAEARPFAPVRARVVAAGKGGGGDDEGGSVTAWVAAGAAALLLAAGAAFALRRVAGRPATG